MKLIINARLPCRVILLLILISFLAIHSRTAKASSLLPLPTQDMSMFEASEVQQQGTASEDLMGVLEKCNPGDDDEEDCINRRILAEAHLDYIYTQHHKP